MEQLADARLALLRAVLDFIFDPDFMWMRTTDTNN
jgi:hypothetical protein